MTTAFCHCYDKIPQPSGITGKTVVQRKRNVFYLKAVVVSTIDLRHAHTACSSTRGGRGGSGNQPNVDRGGLLIYKFISAAPSQNYLRNISKIATQQ